MMATRAKWKHVGRLHRRNDFAGNPIESLHLAIRRLAPRVRNISDVAVTVTTNEHLRTRLESALRKENPHYTERHIEIGVGMAMLEYSPCDLPEDGSYEDFHLYVRRKSDKRKDNDQ